MPVDERGRWISYAALRAKAAKPVEAPKPPVETVADSSGETTAAPRRSRRSKKSAAAAIAEATGVRVALGEEEEE